MMRSQPRWRSAREGSNPPLFTITDAELQAASKARKIYQTPSMRISTLRPWRCLRLSRNVPPVDGKEVARLMQGMAAIGWIMGCHNTWTLIRPPRAIRC